MEANAALSLASSLLAFTSSALIIAQNITRGREITQVLTEELEVVELILSECVQTLTSHIEAQKGDIPRSIERCLELCVKKRNDAISVMEKIYGDLSEEPKFRRVRYAIFPSYQERLSGKFNSFRDTAMLLRDLTSDLRIETHMGQLRIAIELLRNEDRQFDTDAATSTASVDNVEEHHQDKSDRPSRPRRRADANRAYYEFIALQKFDFRREIFILIELPGVKGADMYEHIPVQNIVDLGSNEENFISRELLTNHGMDPAKIRQLSDDERTGRSVDTISGKFTPTDEVTLYWHRLKDTKQRRARFLVVDSDKFDVIIGHKLWSATEGPSHGYLAIPGYQSWKERRKTKKGEKEKVQQAWALIKRQKEEATSGSSEASSSADNA
ncbi:hypothetical protein QBC40DRAFT_254138 [Triangularia verruculosa]|uniref:Fungal N-terminal domain-containing protein n=1 Tax=Triangularia verruculosa TaxID=2587418 RepID=A0AAN6XMA2_9PEZI|nr:hypothetical protein QBC40DRAFT_254138 [Triangularia verruculosa]